jgi:hypothetical protein
MLTIAVVTATLTFVLCVIVGERFTKKGGAK